ncbi:MAG: lysine--tRNA ligase [Candidatus Pacebacteria bacterium]|nr:lysine--tRNA ligase [Candidatus Paceibacterota bacterium]NUQ57398.1 lysine--tRNA ligase [Candidatus Paceibacter sp.]
MSTFEEIRGERLKKLNNLKEKGINPYPVSVSKDFEIKDILGDFDRLAAEGKEIKTAGRIMAIRAHGGSVFFDLQDGGGKIQAYIKKDEIGEPLFNLFFENADIGDFVEVAGAAFLTKKQEKSVKVSAWEMAAKSLRPLPEKWHGLSDTEERFRRRYLDLLMNEDVRKRFLLRSKVVGEIRKYLNEKGFLEAETPVLQTLAGGATAEPFKTHHNALDIDLYLRIAPELYLKRLLVGGFAKVYELSRNFRNEGIDATHNPEFTMLEVYEAYRDADYLMNFTEEFLKNIVKNSIGESEVKFGENTISFSGKFARVKYFDLFKEMAEMKNVETASREDYAKKAEQLGIKVESFETKEKVMDNIYKKVCRPKLIQPVFITDYPAGASPLAKRKENNPDLIDRFQLVVGGYEIVNAFSELNDPIDQKERFKEQDKAKERGDKEVSPSDEDYLEAMEYGMPPAAGLGLGVDRLIMIFTDAHNIKEVILFPTMRPK